MGVLVDVSAGAPVSFVCLGCSWVFGFAGSLLVRRLVGLLVLVVFGFCLWVYGVF